MHFLLHLENNLISNSAKSEGSSKAEESEEEEENTKSKAHESYEVAWQCLETARIILRQHDPDSIRFEHVVDVASRR